MNNRYSSPPTYYPRWIIGVLQDASRHYPVVVLTGAYQVGKSTLLLNAASFRNWHFHTLDDLDTLRQARERPEALGAGADRVIIIDEVQRAPELLSAIKQVVNRRPQQLRFTLSGSATCQGNRISRF